MNTKWGNQQKKLDTLKKSWISKKELDRSKKYWIYLQMIKDIQENLNITKNRLFSLNSWFEIGKMNKFEVHLNASSLSNNVFVNIGCLCDTV